MTLHLGSEAAGQRLDRALVAALASAGHVVTRSALAHAFERGEVVADGKRLKPGRTVDRDLTVEVTLPVPEPLRAEPEDIPLHIVHEDDAILIVDKPASLPVHIGPGHPTHTLVGAVLHHLQVGASELPVLPGNDPTRPGIVHRLDKDTSGLVVVTKTPVAQARLAEQFRRHTIDREYLGVVDGTPPWTELRVDTTHRRDPRDRRRFSPVGEGGRRAVTRMRVEKRLYGATVLRFTLRTGRTHQIRMHARHVGHPILGDTLYGRRPSDPRVATAVDRLERHALHAAVLGFDHPLTGERVRFESPLPESLQTLVDTLSTA